MRWLVILVGAALAGCVGSLHWPGTLAGAAQGSFQLDSGKVESKTVHADGTPDTRTGVLTSVRYAAGVAMAMSKYGTLSGIEMATAGGYLGGDAPKHAYLESEIGGMIQPLLVRAGPAVIGVLGDFGVGFTLDDRYTYAGTRLSVGPKGRTWGVDAAYRRRFGDTPGNEGAHEDRLTGGISFRPGKAKMRIVTLGLEYVRGDQRTLDHGMEVARDDYLLRGRYTMMSVVLSIGAADRPDKVKLDFE